MGKLFFSMLIGAAVLMVMTDDSTNRLKDTARTAVLAVTEVAYR